MPLDLFLSWWPSNAPSAMTIFYFDSSAFLKLIIDEAGSDVAASMWDGADLVVSSRLARPEVAAALAAAVRSGRVDHRQDSRVQRRWTEIWGEVGAIELTERVAENATSAARQFALGGADAVHLASALALEDPGAVFAVWDRRLHAAAAAAGVSVVPRRLD
jgi:predicted nucleic acid-binding protein